MKKLITILLSVLIAFSCCFVFSACGGIIKSTTAKDVATNEAADDYELMTDTSTSTGEGATVSTNRKIIETIALTLQTKDFDTLLEKINGKVAELGGYIEASEIDGREMDSTDTRWAELTVRIPSDKSGKFGNYIEEYSVVVNRSVTTEDVTLKYVDTESRIGALKAEKESLEKLLKNAASVEDIISVREKLTEVIYEIESLESQLRTYDNLIDYTTVTLTINEVERTTITEKQTVWQEIGTNLKNNFSDMWSILVALFVLIISAIPYLIPLGVIVAVIILIIKLRNKKFIKKQTKPQDK